MTGVRPGRCHTAISTAWTTNWRSCWGLAVKSRSKWLRVPASGVPEGLLRQRRRCGTPHNPAGRIRRAIRWCPHRSPAHWSSSQIRGLPLTPSASAWS